MRVFTEDGVRYNNAKTYNSFYCKVDDKYIESAPKRKVGSIDCNMNGGFRSGKKDDRVTSTYHCRFIIPQHKQLSDIEIKELAPKEKDGTSDSKEIGGYWTGLTVDNLPITYHSEFKNVILQRNASIVNSSKCRHILSRSSTVVYSHNKRYRN